MTKSAALHHPRALRTLAALLVFLSPIVVLEFLNFTGFCYQEGRHLSDEQMVDAAIRHNIVVQSIGSTASTKHYDSVAEFRSLNPDCCSIYRYGHTDVDPIWVRAFGFYRIVVDVWFKATSGFYHSLVTLDACGRIVDTAGIPESHGRIVPGGTR